ncbi:MAG: hypothetical protein WBM02_02440, partial [bacterium]
STENPQLSTQDSALRRSQNATLSEHDYRIKGLTGLVFSFLESNPAHLCNLWNRVQTVIRDAKSITSHQVLDISNY